MPAVDVAKLPAAVGVAYTAAQSSPGDAAAVGRLGMILHAYQQWGAAEAAYRRAEALDSRAFAWPYYLSAVYAQEGNAAAALAAIKRALARDANYAPAKHRLAEMLLEAGRFDESFAHYGELSDAQGWYGRGRVHSARGETGAAIAAFRKACALFPEYGAAHYALAQALRNTAEGRQHLALYEAHRLAAPSSEDRLLGEVRKLNAAGTEYLRQGADLEAQGKIAESVAAHLKALEADPKLEQAHINLISLYGRSGQPAKAEEHYHSAVALNPNRAECYYNFGVLEFSRGKPSRAAFEQALRIDPNYAEAHANLGYVLEASGNVSTAETHYRAAILNKPDYRLAHFHLGRVLTNSRRYAEAIAHFERALTPVDGSTPGYRYALGAAFARSGNVPRARGILEQARDEAAARGQAGLVASIEKDLRTLGRR